MRAAPHSSTCMTTPDERVGGCDERGVRFVQEIVVDRLGRPSVCETKSEDLTNKECTCVVFQPGGRGVPVVVRCCFQSDFLDDRHQKCQCDVESGF